MTTALRQREPRVRDKEFLDFVRSMPCCVCGNPPRSEAAHIRMACPEMGKLSAGFGRKSDDRFCTSLCHSCHMAQHARGEAVWWGIVGINPFTVAQRLAMAFAGLTGRQPGCKGAGNAMDMVRSSSGWTGRSKSAGGARPATGKASPGPQKRKWPSAPLKSASRWPKRKVR